MNFSNMNIKTFIDYIITLDNVDEILNKCNSQSEKGFIFERLFDIVIKFGFCEVFNNLKFNHLIGNSNTADMTLLNNFNEYLESKVISGNKGGSSDITLQNKKTKTYIFISSKYPKSSEDDNKQKSVSYYDIQNILAMTTNNIHIYKKYIIYLLVHNREKVLKKAKKAKKTNEYITNHITENNILDKDNLNRYFINFKRDIIKNKMENWNELYLGSMENLNLRFHQELITQKTSDLIDKGNKHFLWGCKCRSGKSYLVAGIILKQFNIKKKLNVLIITPAPTETIPQFTEDLFYKFRDFIKFKIHNIDSSKSLETLEIVENNIFIISKQLLQFYIKDKTIMKIKNLKLDIIAFDESHFTGCTDLSKDILTSYSSNNTIKLYLTATYNKPLREWNISDECQMYWDIEDEQICKSILNDVNNLQKLRDKHGDNFVSKTIVYFENSGISTNDIFKCYAKMPDLHIITNMFDNDRYENIMKKIKQNNLKSGFCFNTLFELNYEKEKFYYENEVKYFLRYISGSNKEEDGDKTIYQRIITICSTANTRYPFTQIWFLPPNNINEISLCLIEAMKDNKIFKQYDVLCINRKNTKLVKDVKNEINKREIEAKSKGKNGLILLAGNMLSLGITLNLCDMVILMNNSLSSDKVLQQMYRCMTEGKNKKMGFVVDLNIGRVLNTCINYTIYKNENNLQDKLKYMINNRLISIDVDMMLNKTINSNTLIDKLMNIWKENPINSFKTLLKKLDEDYEDFDNATQNLINSHFTKSTNKEKIFMNVILMDEDSQKQIIPTDTKTIIGDDNLQNNSNTEEKEEIINKQITQISFTKDILPYIIPLTCILTIKNSNMDFVKMLNDIKENPDLLDIFDEQCLIWWKRSGLIDLIKKIVSTYFNSRSNTFNISIQFKLSLQSLIDRPKELLELINDCLKPKEIEKKENGEVFTPMFLINEMLDKLPIETWSNKNLKWFDPATGMGNFQIAVYLRLMEGLNKEIPNIIERKKHILENMLYMCELNKKNVLVCKQIFDIQNNYKLNLYQGDTLKFEPETTFEIKLFDIILGNPPFNRGGIRSHTGKHLGDKNETIWNKFVEKSFQWLKPEGYLLFINPLSWLKKSHSVHDIMLEKYIIWMKLTDNSKSKEIINADIPISFYVLKNINNINKYKTNIISMLKRRNLTIHSTEYLNKKYSTPLAYHTIFNKLIVFIETNNLQLEFKTKTIKSIGNKTTIPKNYNLTDMLAVDTYTIKEGIMVKTAIENHPDANKRKLIISNKASFNGAFIDEGKLSLTGCGKYYILGDNLESILKLLSFKISNIICHYTKYGQDFLNNEAFAYLPDIRKLNININDISEDKLYKLINLNEDEIKLITS